MTGYYSTDLYQTVDKIEASPDCVQQPAFPDYSKLKPNPSIRSYRVTMQMDYSARGGHIDIKVNSGGRPLIPWQPYANYILTGGYVFYAYCADSFDVTSYRATPEAHPSLTENMIDLDPETAAEKHSRKITLSYTCRREPKSTDESSSK